MANHTPYSASDCMRHGLPLPEGTTEITVWVKDKTRGMVTKTIDITSEQ